MEQRHEHRFGAVREDDRRVFVTGQVVLPMTRWGSGDGEGMDVRPQDHFGGVTMIGVDGQTLTDTDSGMTRRRC